MKKRGFTLVELLAVIAIISILATIGVTAVIKIYNDSIKKTMIVQENNVAEASKSYLEDYCIDPLDNSYKCPSSYENNSDTRYICLSDLQDNEKGNYVSKVNYKNKECKGIIVFSKNDDGDYIKAKTYLYCDYDSNNKKYNYVTDDSLDTSKYPRCNIASGIIDPGETTSTTTTTTKKVQTACTYSGELKQGVEYVSGQYTYRYKQRKTSSGWDNISTDGWGVALTDKNSTNAVTTKLCNSINGKPVVSMSYMFALSKASSIDISSFDTSNVTDMNEMFFRTETSELNLNNLNTSNVNDMRSMFAYSKTTTINGLTNFNTSKVSDMGYMFSWSSVNTIDLSSFNTVNVKTMENMFETSNATTIKGIEKLNTSNVTNMYGMFWNTRVTSLDLSNFNTSKVTDMRFMFNGSWATTIKGIEKLNTRNVTNMSGMFGSTQLTTLDLSNFNTSNVTNMSEMFYSSKKLKTIYTSNSFVTNKVTNSTNMFKDTTDLIGGFGTKYNSSKIDKGYAKIDNCNNTGYFTDKINPSSFATDSWSTIAYSARNGNTCKYNLGDTKSVDVGTFGTHTVRVSNLSTPSSCSSSTYSQTACGFVIEFEDIIVRYNMNPAGTYNGKSYQYGTNVGGWPASKLRTYLNNDIFKQLPSDLRSVIINTKVISGHGSKESSNFTSTDKLYLLSPTEVWGDWTGMWDGWSSTGSSSGTEVDTAKSSSRQLDYYVRKGTSFKNYGATRKSDGKVEYFWWHRSARYSDDIQFYGMRGYGHAYRDGGISPAFKVG